MNERDAQEDEKGCEQKSLISFDQDPAEEDDEYDHYDEREHALFV